MARIIVGAIVSAIALGFCAPVVVSAQPEMIALVVKPGTPIHVALTERVSITRVEQVVSGVLAEPVYVYDRVVLPAGSLVRGHVIALDPPRRLARVHAYASGDFSPHRRIVLQFDTIVLPDHAIGEQSRTLEMRAEVTSVSERATLKVSAAAEPSGVAARAREEVATRVSETLQTITAPGKMARLKEALIDRLPYHRQYFRQGTVFTAELRTPIDFGTVPGVPRAAAGTLPAPDSVLAARLLTPLASSTSERGEAIQAIVTHPVFSEAHELILPEGVVLEGAVTFVRPARHFHRNGQLRFLFQTVRAPATQDPVTLLASLYAVRVNDADQVTIDEEGGATIANSNTRFIAPALAILALRGATRRELDEPDEPGQVAQINYGNPALGGFFGWGLAGVAASQISRPIGVGLSIVGVVRTVYGSVFGKGREVVFPANTPIELQLAPAHGTGQ